MNNWIFQGTPDKFNVDEYLKKTSFIYWSVSKLAHQSLVKLGDPVLIWRAQGKNYSKRGVVAFGVIEEECAPRAKLKRPIFLYDNLWNQGPQEEASHIKAGVKILEVRLSPQDGMVTVEQILSDPLLKEMQIIKVRQGSNFLINDEEYSRLLKLWNANSKNQAIDKIKNFFRIGEVYKRTDIHDQFGGNVQSGFSASAEHPVIFIFTSEEGLGYGYEDGWKEDGFLHIAGEGQVGDMKFTRGNRAIRDHINDKKRLLYFEGTAQGRVYRGEVQYIDWYEKTLKDRNGELRKGIIFRLQSVGALDFDKKEEEVGRLFREGSEQKVVQTVKERNPALREAAIKKYGTTCMVCNFNFNKFYGEDIAKAYIEVHHEKMVSEIEGERDVSVNDVKVVCSNCHRVIHRKRKMIDWKELKLIIEKRES